MKHHDAGRPIGKCKGCCLNLRTYCAAGLSPKLLWSRGRCAHYGDNDLLQAVESRGGPEGATLARRQRQAKAGLAGTVPHYDGQFDAVKLAGRIKRHRT
ncbi:MAG TPA: hypothetical protein VMZ50_08840 [Phycisphaerae bacterium]|nr:hypothetical protein [Phycisphaerae bacterium]